MATLETLLAKPLADRNEAWEADFLRELPKARVKVLAPEPRQGPDNWPYLMVSTDEGDDALINVLDWLAKRGIGLAINPQRQAPDYVLSYGMLWNFKERGEFFSQPPRAQVADSQIELKPGQELLTGAPSEAYLPGYVRGVIKQFLMDQGVLAPKVLMVSFDKQNYDLCFSTESFKSPPESEHAGIAEALSWFLPAHYSVVLISEKSVPGFGPL